MNQLCACFNVCYFVSLSLNRESADLTLIWILCSCHHGLHTVYAQSLGTSAVLLQHFCKGQWTQHPLQASSLRQHSVSVALHLNGKRPQHAGLQPLLQWPKCCGQWQGDHAGPERPAGQLPGQGALIGEVQRWAGGEDQAANAGKGSERAWHRGYDGPGTRHRARGQWQTNQMWEFFLEFFS